MKPSMQMLMPPRCYTPAQLEQATKVAALLPKGTFWLVAPAAHPDRA